MAKADCPAPVAITMGDPAGIGPDITLKAFAERETCALPPFYVIADSDMLDARGRALGLPANAIRIPEADVIAPRKRNAQIIEAFAKAIPVLHRPLDHQAVAGQPDVNAAHNVIGSIKQAVADAHAGYASSVVTNPISKDVLYQAGFKYPGHTEFLSHLAGVHWGESRPPVMMLAADEMRVVPATIHIPLKDVPHALTITLIVDTVTTLIDALQTSFGIPKPRVACTGLNPHAGENGNLGTEEQDIIAPAITALRSAGHNVDGPFPADTIFHADARGPYDAIVAMYHDQALIPIKTLAFDRGVNITLGLPFVRTSPDHGTAFAIAGKRTANPRSLIEAIRQAGAMVQARARTDAA